MMMAKILIVAAVVFQQANGLKILQEPAKKNAYVMMWVSKPHIPKQARLTEQWMTPEEEEAEFNIMREQGEVPPTSKWHQASDESVESDSEEWAQSHNASHGGGPKWILNNAKKLQGFGSQYPVVIVTNERSLLAIQANASIQKQYPNVIIKPVAPDEWIPHKCRAFQGHATHFQKLSIWGLTEYDKMIYLDADTIVRMNPDVVFDQYDLQDGNQIWAQADNWGQCQRTAKAVNSGMLLFKPSTAHLNGMKERLMTQKSCWGDQTVISRYFKEDNRMTDVFPQSVISFSHCPGRSMVNHDQKQVGRGGFWWFR
eukprot:gnl/MRDRNA2_/MRDRNA2_31208_c0_seq1.p1 gnl/MRDRNA2_/MRDRNA2_31208_c0~~gnl/MRDRNA2_/MRDRNA2_31208_c0_seq1.p1  ORF type:complete len:313 (+),score=54.70 gnl/MRDRNA2_/MRDRNA2_31208_c0_seq1:128-1066(+)